MFETNASGSDWDAAGGLPDPFVCLTVDGIRRCTDRVDNSFTPALVGTWSGSVTQLRAAYFEVLDYDTSSSNDVICQGTWDLSDALFRARRFSYFCLKAGMDFTLTAQ